MRERASVGAVFGPPTSCYTGLDVACDRQVRWAFLCLGFGLGPAAWAAPALAQQESLAESLFREARADMKRAKPEQACPKLEESYRLDPSIGTLLNLGLCDLALGRVATAWTKLRQFVDAAPAGDARLSLAKQKIAELEKSLPTIRIVVSAAANPAVITLDGVELRNASLGVALPVDPGDHTVLLTTPSGEHRETRVHVGIGETVNVQLAQPEVPSLVERSVDARLAGPAAAPVDPGSAPPPTVRVSTREPKVSPVPNAQHRRTERTLAYIASAAGTYGLLTSGLFGILAFREKRVVAQRCPDHICRDQVGLDATRAGSRNETIANVAFVAGALTLATGVVLFWHSGRTEMALSAGPASASLSFLGTMP